MKKEQRIGHEQGKGYRTKVRVGACPTLPWVKNGEIPDQVRDDNVFFGTFALCSMPYAILYWEVKLMAEKKVIIFGKEG